MKEEKYGVNFMLAKLEADKVDEKIIAVLKSGDSFRVEAGAGSGKTYSLNKVIEWIQANKQDEYKKNNQNVICITYTNAAVDVIKNRLSKDTFVLPSTIHSFAWNTIKQYQGFLINKVTTEEDFISVDGDFDAVREVAYTLGHRYKEKGVYYLYHDDVLKLFCMMLDNVKFRRIFSSKNPLILIDEYQDSYGPIIERFLRYFISEKKGPQFGFFGDAWQTIYQLNQVCGEIENENLRIIKKGSNFRSAPRIVQLLNFIRADLPQKSAIDNCEGEVVAITSQDYTQQRRKYGFFKDDLPAEELRTRLRSFVEKIKEKIPQGETIKVLMITHKVLATQQRYEKLLEVLNNGLRNKEDPFLMFFMRVVEPVYHALEKTDMNLLFSTLQNRFPITKKSEKIAWKDLQKQLNTARQKRAIDVFEVINNTGLIPVPPLLHSWYTQYKDEPDTVYASTTIGSFLNIDYEQFISAIDFLYPDALYSTEHSVKGEEYDNIVFVISKGWIQYQFEKYAPMMTGKIAIPEGEQEDFERNRNLFYVCCSRPKKRLFFFITIPIDEVFESFLEDLVGKENIYTYSKYLEKSI